MTSAILNQPLGLDSWGLVDQTDRRFRRIARSTLAAVAATAIVVPWLHWQEPEPDTLATVIESVRILPDLAPPPRVKPPAEPKPAPEKTAPPHRQPVATPAHDRSAAAAPSTLPTPTTPGAREIASQSGLLRYRSSLAALHSDQALDAFSQNVLTSAATDSAPRPAGAGATLAARGSSGGIGHAGAQGIAGQDAGTRLGMRRTEAVQDGIGIGQGARGDGTGPAAGSGTGNTSGRTPQEIQLAFDRDKTAFFALFNRAARQTPGMQAGTIMLRLTIQPDGSVSDCAIVSSSFGDPDLEAKVLQRVRLMNFGARNVSVYVHPQYPLTYLPP